MVRRNGLFIFEVFAFSKSFLICHLLIVPLSNSKKGGGGVAAIWWWKVPPLHSLLKQFKFVQVTHPSKCLHDVFPASLTLAFCLSVLFKISSKERV